MLKSGLCELIQTSSNLEEIHLYQVLPKNKMMGLLKCIFFSLKVKNTHIPLLVRFSKFSIRISTVKSVKDSNSYRTLFEIYKILWLEDININKHKSYFTTWDEENLIKQVELFYWLDNQISYY